MLSSAGRGHAVFMWLTKRFVNRHTTYDSSPPVVHIVDGDADTLDVDVYMTRNVYMNCTILLCRDLCALLFSDHASDMM